MYARTHDNMIEALTTREVNSYSVAPSRLRSLCAHYGVEKLTCESILSGHRGCVNSVLFSWDGQRIYTGSDDMHIHIYDTYISGCGLERSPKPHCRIKTKHHNNIFYCKDLPATNGGKLVTCAADGKVCLQTLEDGGRYESLLLARHLGRAHRLAVHPYLPNQIYSCGEDGKLLFIDIRIGHVSDIAESPAYMNFSALRSKKYISDAVYSSGIMKTHFQSFTENQRTGSQSIYCISVNPVKEYEIACSGESNAVSLYDARKFDTPFGHLMPRHLWGEDKHISGVKYNWSGTEILASYNDDDVYSFDIAQHMTTIGYAASSSSKLSGYPKRSKVSNSPAVVKHTKRSTSGDDESDGESESEKIDVRNDGIVNSKASVGGGQIKYSDSGFRGGDENSEDEKDINDENEDEEMDTSDEEEQGSSTYLRCFAGHRNYLTVKQVAYHGERSEFVVSGSDCGNLFIWDSGTGKIVRTLFADKRGAINCITSHPFDTLLATSGLEHSAKLWSSCGKKVSMAEKAVSESTAHIIETNAANATALRNRNSNQVETILASIFDSPTFALRFPGFGFSTNVDDEEDLILPRSIAYPAEFHQFVFLMQNMISADSSDDEDDEDDDDAEDAEDDEDDDIDDVEDISENSGDDAN